MLPRSFFGLGQQTCVKLRIMKAPLFLKIVAKSEEIDISHPQVFREKEGAEIKYFLHLCNKLSIAFTVTYYV